MVKATSSIQFGLVAVAGMVAFLVSGVDVAQAAVSCGFQTNSEVRVISGQISCENARRPVASFRRFSLQGNCQTLACPEGSPRGWRCHYIVKNLNDAPGRKVVCRRPRDGATVVLVQLNDSSIPTAAVAPERQQLRFHGCPDHPNVPIYNLRADGVGCERAAAVAFRYDEITEQPDFQPVVSFRGWRCVASQLPEGTHAVCKREGRRVEFDNAV